MNARGFLLSIHHTPLSDIKFESHIFFLIRINLSETRARYVIIFVDWKVFQIAKETVVIRNWCMRHTLAEIFVNCMHTSRNNEGEDNFESDLKHNLPQPELF